MLRKHQIIAKKDLNEPVSINTLRCGSSPKNKGGDRSQNILALSQFVAPRPYGLRLKSKTKGEKIQLPRAPPLDPPLHPDEDAPGWKLRTKKKLTAVDIDNQI